MNERDWILLLLAGLAAGLLAIVATGPRVIIIPDDEPSQAELLGVWKGNRK